MKWISITEKAHPPVDERSGESDYVLTYAGKRLLPIVAQYCTPPNGTGRKKSHWRNTRSTPLKVEPKYWAYIDYPDVDRESLEAQNTEYEYGHNVPSHDIVRINGHVMPLIHKDFFKDDKA